VGVSGKGPKACLGKGVREEKKLDIERKVLLVALNRGGDKLKVPLKTTH